MTNSGFTTWCHIYDHIQGWRHDECDCSNITKFQNLPAKKIHVTGSCALFAQSRQNIGQGSEA